ncbi:MAG TPA: HD domain-containing protein [Flavisolibacter sp.]|jgi:predicted metal-dependent HD superfamily phosphohydrolase|nr:HD domain-containing protein [Flavisolibacter sp.]
MNEYQTGIVADAEKTVTDIFENNIEPLFVFHNLEHTRQVVNAVKTVGSYYRLTDEEQFILAIAGWFHDTGFSSGKVEEHEKGSIELATRFLRRHNADPHITSGVTGCIRATHMPQEPQNLIEKILCDADLYHLGTKSFNERSGLLKKELENYYQNDLPEEEWRQLNIGFLQSHKYFTAYCRQALEPVKLQWIEHLQNV